MLITEYINPWHNSRDKSSPAVYKANESTKQEEYKGYYIVQGVNPWVDVVENVDDAWWCVTQRGSVKNAKEFIDGLYEDEGDNMQISKEEYNELLRYRETEERIYEREKAERLANDRWLADTVADLQKRKDSGERFELG